MKKIVAIDLFCGVGGLTHGLIKAGIDVRAGIDNDGTCKFAYEKNNSSEFIKESIRNIKGKNLKKYYKGADVKVLVGCAPCQTFSTHSTKLRKQFDLKKDKRWNLLTEFSRFIDDLKPHIVSMENVPLLLKQKVFIDFKNNLLKSGYEVSYEIVNCSKYGMPQNRRRLVLLASKMGKIEIPKPNNKIKTVNNKINSLHAPKLILVDPVFFLKWTLGVTSIRS